jgi:hypothetical protein
MSDEAAFSARELSRVTSPEGRVVALMAIGEVAEFGVADEVPAVGNLGPETLGGTSVATFAAGVLGVALLSRVVVQHSRTAAQPHSRTAAQPHK